MFAGSNLQLLKRGAGEHKVNPIFLNLIEQHIKVTEPERLQPTAVWVEGLVNARYQDGAPKRHCLLDLTGPLK